jgi:hypothetical protein
MKLGEVACQDVKEKLQVNLPGRIAAINVEMDDDLTMIAPNDSSYFTGRMADFPDCPAIFVMEGPTRFKQEGPHGLLSAIQVLVYVFESGQTGDHLSKRLQRQVRSVIESLYEGEPRERTANGFNLTPERTVPGLSFKPDSPHEWRGYYTVIFKVEQLEL